MPETLKNLSMLRIASNIFTSEINRNSACLSEMYFYKDSRLDVLFI